jgi:hypothetical protein
MSFLKNAFRIGEKKEPVDEEDSTPHLPPAVRPTQRVNLDTTVPRAALTTPSRPMTNAPVDDEEFQNILKVLGGVQVPKGVQEFFELYTTLEKHLKDPAARFEAAFETVGSTTGLTKDMLLQALQNQQLALEKDKKEFSEGIENTATEQKRAFTERAESLTRDITNANQELAALTQKITDLKDQQKSATQQASEIDVKKQRRLTAYGTAYQAALNGSATNKWVGLLPLLNLMKEGGTNV